MKKTLVLLSFLTALTLSFQALAQEEVDYVALAGMLIKNGYFDRAETTLEKINLKEDPYDKSRYLALRGMILLNQKKYIEAQDFFTRALSEKEADPEIYLYQAETLFHLKEFDRALETIQKSDPESKKTSGYFVLQSNILWQQGKKDNAWEVLRTAPQAGVPREVLIKQQFQYVLEEGLYLTAQDLIYLALKLNVRAKDVAVMAGLLREKKQVRLGVGPLELAKYRWPQSTEILLELAYSYLKMEKTLSAATLLESAARLKPELANEAVELLRHAGKDFRAEILLASIPDESSELKQRVGIYLSRERYDLVAHLSPRLSSTGLLQDEELRYALAYSFYALGEFEKAQWHLNQLGREDLFEKALEIKKTIADCRETPWLCHESI